MKLIDVYTINKDWKNDLAVGALVGIAFILLNLLTGISIGFPDLPQATEGERLIIVGAFAPVAEELGFRATLYPILDTLTGPVISVIVTALIFSIFHAVAYAGGLNPEQLLAAQGAFIGAAIFGVVAALLTKWRGNFTSAVVAHAIFNTFLVTKAFVIVA